MKIIESFIQGKQNNPFLCEDALFISSKGVAVIDGATSKTKNLNGSSTPGRQAAQLIRHIGQNVLIMLRVCRCGSRRVGVPFSVFP